MADQEETKYCSNCKRQIAVANFIMHEVHCRRNIILCEKCEEPVPRSEMESHFDEYHAKVPCTLCNQKFEKSFLDDHMPLCPKRTVHCDYCQLDMAASDLDEHKDYCGTRTEQCPLCSQYIMHRDRDQHELSMCAYPIPKHSPDAPSNIGAAPAARPVPAPDAAEEFDAQLLNPFAMNELSRMLNESSRSQPVHNNVSVSGASTRTTHASGSRRSHIKPRPRLEINRNISRTKNTNESVQSRRSNNTNRPPVNTRSEGWGRGGPRNNPDLDEILARHLAQDLDPDVFADGHIPHVDQPNNFRPVRHSPPINMEQDSEEVQLPCEFCSELFPVDVFFEHQNSCSPNSVSAYRNVSEPVDVSPVLSPSDNYDNFLPNNSPRRSTTSNSQPSRPHIVDNLSMLAAQDWFSSPAAAAAGGMDGETMLPCEFCDQLFPDDLLVQHQAVCEVDAPTPTPHSRSSQSRSSTTSGSIRSRANIIGASGVEGTTRSRTSRRQADPVFGLHGDSGMDEIPLPTSTSTRGRNGKSSHRGINRDSNRNPITGARSRGSGVNTFSSTSSRPGRTTSKPMNVPSAHNPVSEPAFEREPSSTTAAHRASPHQRRQGSATHTNRTLEQLLKDPHITTNELLEAMDKEEKSNRNVQMRDSPNGTDRDNRDHGDLSLNRALNGGKSRRSNRSTDDYDGGSRYDPSFAASSRPAPRVSSKPRPVLSRAADFTGSSNLRVGKPRTTNTAASRATEPTRPSNTESTTRKRTSSRPRNAPQGEP